MYINQFYMNLWIENINSDRAVDMIFLFRRNLRVELNQLNINNEIYETNMFIRIFTAV